jgi:hypothetical protein
MGHLRLGVLPAGRRWNQVVELLATGGEIGALAEATAHAAEAEFRRASGDPALRYTVWLLTQLPLAARSPQFAARLGELGFEAGSEQSLLGLVSGLTSAIDAHVSDRGDRTDLGELARLAAAESLSAAISAGLPSLFETTAGDVRLELGKLTNKDRFAKMTRDFFARLTLKTLEYYISRELPNHVGPGKALASIDKQIEFRGALERHCREASLIVEEFAGGWYSKANYKGGITPAQAQAFTEYTLTKMRAELRARRGR